MDLAAIHDRTGLPTRLLRYVLDHGVLPGSRAPAPGRGRGTARRFTDFEAFGIACAALMLRAGVRRRTASQLFDLLCASPPRSGNIRRTHSPFESAYSHGQAMTLEIGDGINYRLRSTSATARGNVDTGWVQAPTGAGVVDGYTPMVHLILNVKVLRDELKEE